MFLGLQRNCKVLNCGEPFPYSPELYCLYMPYLSCHLISALIMRLVLHRPSNVSSTIVAYMHISGINQSTSKAALNTNLTEM